MKARRAKLQVLSPSTIEAPRATLTGLKENFGACCLKLSTEDAAMGFDQIGAWVERFRDVLPVRVKIGGPNARNDIKELIARNVDGLIAPMVESAYGLENFIDAVKTFTTPLQFNRLNKAVNIETVTAVRELRAILESPYAESLDEITIGCTDLSQSMGREVTDPQMTVEVRKAVQLIHQRGLPVSVGGGITPSNIDSRLGDLKPDKFNTRLVTFECRKGLVYDEAVEQALEFELLMLSHDRLDGFISPDEESHRASALRERLG